MIRAVQGHSMKEVKDEETLSSISADIAQEVNVFQFSEVVHGTYRGVLSPIMENGLCRMARNNIHMAIGLP